MKLDSIFLMAPTEGGEGGGTQMFMMLGLMMVVFYFFMIRPQVKKNKAAQKFKESLEKGTKVVTIGGIHGKIAEIKDTTIILDVEGGQRLKVEKSAISVDGNIGTAEKK